MSVAFSEASSDGPGKAADRPLEIVVVNGRRFEAEMMAAIARSACPGAAVHVYGDGESLVSPRADHPADLCLIALELPDADGLELLRGMDEARLPRRSLLLVDRLTEVACARLAGGLADGFFDCTLEQGHRLEAAIFRMLAEGSYSSYSLREARHRALAGRTPLVRILSELELLVFATIADGADDATAGRRLGLSPAAVHTHRQRIMRKLDLHSRAELTAEACFRGLSRLAPNGQWVRAGYPDSRPWGRSGSAPVTPPPGGGLA